MDGVFMKKILKITLVLLTAVLTFQALGVIRDKHYLQNSLIRMHIVANSDDAADQKLKLTVRDRVLAYLDESMDEIMDKATAMEYLSCQLETIRKIAQQTVNREGYDYPVNVSLQREDFPTRVYDTFSLPTGRYDALRINIGDAAGRNWWCVTFPNLCLPATGETFVDAAADAGFSDTLTKSLDTNGGYRFRFYLLEQLGKLENLFHR